MTLDDAFARCGWKPSYEPTAAEVAAHCDRTGMSPVAAREALTEERLATPQQAAPQAEAPPEIQAQVPWLMESGDWEAATPAQAEAPACNEHPEFTVLLQDGTYKCEICGATPLPAQAAEQVGGWRHKANEWADMATNGIQWLRNVRDGISTPEEALVEMEANHDRIQALATPAPQPVSADTAAQGLLEQAEAEVMRCAREAALAVAANKRTHPANWYGVVAAVRRLAALSPQQAEPGKGADRG